MMFSKKLWFQIHGWLGLYTGLLLFVVCVSGTIAVLSHEIDWLIYPELRVSDTGEQLPLNALYDSARHAYPDAYIYAVHAPVNSNFAAEVRAYFPEQLVEHQRILVNPYTAEVQGITAFYGIQRFFRTYHMMFFLPTVGKYIVCVLGLVLLVSVVSGLMIYRKWWTKLFSFRANQGMRIFFSDLHRGMGVWCLLFSLIIAITSIWYLTEAVLHEFDLSFSESYSHIDLETDIPSSETLNFSSAEAIYNTAQQAYPELDIRGLLFPYNRDHGVSVHGQAKAVLVRNRANQVFINPFNAEVMSVEKGENLGPVSRLAEMADPLHFGTFGGLVVKIIWFLFGLLLSVSVLAGTLIWFLRRHSKNRGKLRIAGSVFWTLLIVAIFGATGFCSYWGSMMYLVPDPFGQSVYELGKIEVGPWQLHTRRLGDASEGEPLRLRINPGQPEVVANYKKMEIWLGSKEDKQREARVHERNRFHVNATIRQIPPFEQEPALWFRLTSRDGDVHYQEVPFEQWSGDNLVFKQTVTASLWQDHVPFEVSAFIVLYHIILFFLAVPWLLLVQLKV